MISSKRFRDDHHLGSIRGNIGFKFPRNTVSDVNRERNGLGFPRNTVQDANRGKSEGNSPGERQGCRFIGQCPNFCKAALRKILYLYLPETLLHNRPVIFAQPGGRKNGFVLRFQKFWLCKRCASGKTKELTHYSLIS